LLVTDAGATPGPVGHSVKRIAVSGTAVDYCTFAIFTCPVDIRSLVALRTGFNVTAQNVPTTGLSQETVTQQMADLAVEFFTTKLARSVADPSPVFPGRFRNGAFALAETVRVRANAAAFGPLGNLLTHRAPISNDTVTIDFQQHIGPNEALRTGAYSKSLTFTLSTTRP
jgi:hypothetical protein